MAMAFTAQTPGYKRKNAGKYLASSIDLGLPLDIKLKIARDIIPNISTLIPK